MKFDELEKTLGEIKEKVFSLRRSLVEEGITSDHIAFLKEYQNFFEDYAERDLPRSDFFKTWKEQNVYDDLYKKFENNKLEFKDLDLVADILNLLDYIS